MTTMKPRCTPFTDEELIAAWRRDPGGADAAGAAAELLGRYGPSVYRWCYRYVRNREAALDLSQDVFLAALLKLDRLRDGQRFGAWLFAIARNRCLASMRRRRRRGWTGAAIDVDDLPAAAPSPEQRLLDRLALENVLSLLDGVLDLRERQALVLRCCECMPVDRITEAMGLENASGARGLLQTARRKLRAELTRTGGAPAVVHTREAEQLLSVAG